MDMRSRACITRAATCRADDLDIGQKLHVERYRARAIARRAAQGTGVVAKGTCLKSRRLGLGRTGEGATQLVMDVGISCHRRAYVGADRRSVNQVCTGNAFGIDPTHVPRQALAGCLRLKRRDERLEHQRRLARTRNARHRDQATAWDIDFERLDGMDGIGRHADMALVEHFVVSHLRPQALGLRAQKRGDAAALRLFDLVHRTRSDHITAACSGNGAHLDEIIGFRQYARVVIDNDHGVAVIHQIAHHAYQAVDIGRMQTDRGLVQHIEYARRSVAHHAGELHALALTRGERSTGAIERKVIKTQVDQATGHAQKRIADIRRHGLHLVRQGCGHPTHPLNRLAQCHGSCLRQIDTAHLGLACRLGKTCAAAVAARSLAQKACNALKSLVVLNLGERILDRIDGVVIGKVERRDARAVFGNVENVLLYRRAVKHDIALSGRELVKRHVGAHAHLAGHLLHQVPHERAPGKHRTLVDSLRLVGHQARLVHLAHDTGAAAGGTRTAAVKGKVLGARRVKLATACRARERQASGNVKARLHTRPAMRAHVMGTAAKE